MIRRLLRKTRTESDRVLYALLMMLRALAHDPLWIGYRALRLLLLNPRLFMRRMSAILTMFRSDPAAGLRAIATMRKRRQEIERSYHTWLAGRATALAIPVEDDGPLLSIIMPVYNTDERLLEETIQSVLGQTYPRWELCIADDASTAPHIRPQLERHEREDSRIRVTSRDTAGHISAASNSALALAGGEFIVLLDHDDLLAPHALASVAHTAAQDSSIDFIYSDEDKIDEEGNRSQPFFKPAWSPTLLTTGNYITHLAAIRRSLVLEVGGFRNEMVGSQDHDLFLRVTERARMVAHIPDVLYSWRMTASSTSRSPSAKPYALDAARRALEDTVKRRGLPATVEETHLSGIFQLRRPLMRRPLAGSGDLGPVGAGPPPAPASDIDPVGAAPSGRPPPAGGPGRHNNAPNRPRVSLIVLGSGDAWRETFQDVNLDVCDIVFLGGSRPRPADGRITQQRLGILNGQQGPPAGVGRPLGAAPTGSTTGGVPLILSDINACSGDYLVFLDASSRPTSAESITGMLEPLQEAHTAVAGGTTRRPDGTVLQAGLTIGDSGQPFYAHRGLSMLPQPAFYLNLKDLPHEVAALYAGCCAVKRETWRQLQGWNQDLPPVLAMCDFCLRARKGEYEIVYTPIARFECSDELACIPSVEGCAWDWRDFADPFWNPHLNPASPDGLPFRQGAPPFFMTPCRPSRATSG